jgi:phosphatidylglycerophosphate synthase
MDTKVAEEETGPRKQERDAAAEAGSGASANGSGTGLRTRALIIPEDPAFLDSKVCGVPLILRMAYALDRATEGVHILRTPACTDSAVRDLHVAAAARDRQPRLVWGDSAEAVPADVGLFVVYVPGVFDQRLCAAVEDVPERDDKVIRYRRPGDEGTLVWFVGKNRTAEFLRWLAANPATPAAITEFLTAQPLHDVNPDGRICEVVRGDRSRRAAEDKLFGAARKESDTWIARNFDRNLSMQLTRAFVALPITPNQVTIIGTSFGLTGALLLALGTYLTQLVGGGFLVLSIIIDGCDGEVARLKYMESEFGRRLDFFLDNIVNVLAIFAVGAGHYWQGGPSIYLYGSIANAAAALASVFPVYWVFFRTTPSGVASPATRKTGLEGLAENVAGRDYVYLVFALALVGRAYWFTFLCLAGIGVFFLIMVTLLLRKVLAPTAPGPAPEKQG